MGEQPLWHRVVVASKFLGVPPWELKRQPFRYVLEAEATMRAEASARENLERIRGR